MAKFLPLLPSQFTIFFILSSFSSILISGEDHGFARTLNKNVLGLKKEKLSHFRVFFHDIVSGSHPTAIRIVPPVSNYSSTTSFGFVSMFDDPLTEGPEMSSKLVGRAQGMYASAAQEEIGLLMVMNFAFIEGKYNGSTISILGRNKVYPKVREMPVIGGSGLFRFARGYVLASTHTFDKVTGDAVVEYNIYVLHY